MKNSWFEVDKEGLRKLVADTSSTFVLRELISNAWDEPHVTLVKISVTREPNSPFVEISVEDDAPEGFCNLSHAWTLFADVRKRRDPNARGRFCLGDKLVLAASKSATILTTTGGVRFDDEGRHVLRSLRPAGSSVVVLIRMNVQEEQTALETLKTMAIAPTGITTVVNGIEMTRREIFQEMLAELPTVLADDEGVMRKKLRVAPVQVLKAVTDGGWLYEMGVPVVRTGDQFDYNVMQKIPVNQERDNVSEAYLKQLRALVLNVVHGILETKEEANAGWVRDACGHRDVNLEATRHVMELRFGKDAVAYDLSDREANQKAMSLGVTVVAGASLSAGEWENVRKAGVVIPAGRFCPTPKMYSNDLNAKMAEIIPSNEWTEFEVVLAALTKKIAKEAGIRVPGVSFVKAGMANGVCACNVGSGAEIHFNVDRLGRKYARKGNEGNVFRLVIHELAHHRGGHFDEGFHDELERLGAVMTVMAMKNSEDFRLPEKE